PPRAVVARARRLRHRLPRQPLRRGPGGPPRRDRRPARPPRRRGRRPRGRRDGGGAASRPPSRRGHRRRARPPRLRRPPQPRRRPRDGLRAAPGRVARRARRPVDVPGARLDPARGGHPMSTPRPAATAPVAFRVLATSALVAVAVVASTYALGSVIGPGGWTGTAVRVVTVLALVTGASRYALERGHAARGETLAPPAALLPSLAGLVAGLWALLGLYGGPTDRFSLLIGLSNVDRVLSRLSTARDLTLAEVA